MTSDKQRDENHDQEPDWLKYGWQISLGVLAAFVILAGLQFTTIATAQWFLGRDDITAFGISGDFFGAINALFTALAFAAIIITLWMQKYELSQQREELETTRNVMKQQQFEATFFRMLELHGEIVNGITGGQLDGHGRKAIGSMVKDLKKVLNEQSPAETLPPKGLVMKYEKWYEIYESEIGHYFRTLYNVVRYVDEFGGDDKQTYARLVRAQLNSDELELLLLNCLSAYGHEKFKPLVERYGLFKHVKGDRFHCVLAKEYDPSAFPGRNMNDE